MKLYVEEFGCRPIRSVSKIVVSAIARVEVPAAMWRKHRIGELDAADAMALTSAFEADFFGGRRRAPRFAVVPLVSSVLDLAANFVASMALRAYDSVQLASAVAARDADSSCNSFACFDELLRTAAAANGFRLVG